MMLPHPAHVNGKGIDSKVLTYPGNMLNLAKLDESSETNRGAH